MKHVWLVYRYDEDLGEEESVTLVKAFDCLAKATYYVEDMYIETPENFQYYLARIEVG